MSVAGSTPTRAPIRALSQERASPVALRVALRGIGLLGPGLTSWAQAREVLSGARPFSAAPVQLPPPARLPPAERRRAGAAVKLALAVADAAVVDAAIDPAALGSVFTSSSGEGAICHAMCETLAAPAPLLSPTRFTNSVHNAAAGFWHIAVASRASSTSLCAFDGSFCAGLIAAATSVHVSGVPMLLVASDSPYPEPLHAKRPLPDHFGVALVLVPAGSGPALAALSIQLVDAGEPVTRCADAALDALRRAIPAAAALPLLAALAPRAATGAASPGAVVLDYQEAVRVRIALA